MQLIAPCAPADIANDTLVKKGIDPQKYYTHAEASEIERQYGAAIRKVATRAYKEQWGSELIDIDLRNNLGHLGEMLEGIRQTPLEELRLAPGGNRLAIKSGGFSMELPIQFLERAYVGNLLGTFIERYGSMVEGATPLPQENHPRTESKAHGRIAHIPPTHLPG